MDSNKEPTKKIVLIIGAGPAGLTAAYELLVRSHEFHPIVCEMDDQVGGLSRTVNYKDNRIDIGGHRFFSKSDKVLDWWLQFLPMETHAGALEITYHNRNKQINPGSTSAIDPRHTDRVMLVRNRLSRIFFARRFFPYPLQLNLDTLLKLGFFRSARIALSYIKAVLFPLKQVKNLEDFFINRFGKELYLTFFKDYTEKVWGIPCTEISPEWGAQRVKNLSIGKAVLHALLPKKDGGIHQKKTETSLIEKFLYPKYGPGHLWEIVAQEIQRLGGELHLQYEATGIQLKNEAVESATFIDRRTGRRVDLQCDHLISTMPVKDLCQAIKPCPPSSVTAVSSRLSYRAFITVGLLLKRLHYGGKPIPDNWIYIQEGAVKVGRIQFFNNWSPFMVKDPETHWIGLEYFCDENDALWKENDIALSQLAAKEIEWLGLASATDILDQVVIRMPKTYPVYSGAYSEFHLIKQYLDSIHNLYLVGRNGMHRYNNQDHSMLTAMQAVTNILLGTRDKENIWTINTEESYHEEK